MFRYICQTYNCKEAITRIFHFEDLGNFTNDRLKNPTISIFIRICHASAVTKEGRF